MFVNVRPDRCPNIPEFTYCMRCGQYMDWINEQMKKQT